MKIYMIRHTRVVAEGYCYGQTNVSLADSFAEEAERVRQFLAPIAHDAVFCSPLNRCARLAEYCDCGDKIQYRDRLKELNFGDWEMRLWNEIDMKEWQDDWIDTPAPGGESFREMYARVSSFLQGLKSESYTAVKIFTHAGVINCAKVYFGHTELKSAFDQRIGYGETLQFEL